MDKNITKELDIFNAVIGEAKKHFKSKNEGADMLHGHRAVEYLLGLNKRGLLPIDAKQLDQLTYACEHHSKRNAKSEDITIQTCWDADRLDLYRVGEIPDPAFLYTEAGKSSEAIDFALRLYTAGT